MSQKECANCGEPMWERVRLNTTDPPTVYGFYSCEACGAEVPRALDLTWQQSLGEVETAGEDLSITATGRGEPMVACRISGPRGGQHYAAWWSPEEARKFAQFLTEAADIAELLHQLKEAGKP